MSHDYSDQYLNKESSDVTLVIDGTELPARRSILCEQSDYFKALFSHNFVECKSDRIDLKETDLNAFKIVLKHMYYCNRENYTIVSILPDDVDEVYKVYGCASFYMVEDLVKEIVPYLEKVDCSTTQLLNNALTYEFDNLVSEAVNRIKEDARNIVELKIFEKLTAQAVEYLLKLKLNTRESSIFGGLVSWMLVNTDKSDLFPKFLKLVDLYILSQEDLEILFRPTKLIDRKVCQELINEQAERTKTAIKIVNENIIDDPSDLCLLQGSVSFRGLSLDCRLLHPEKHEILLDLKQQFLLNCLKFEIKQNMASYAVFVSLNSRDWHNIIDHLNYECFGPQVLYFNERPVRFLRINANRKCPPFSLKMNIEAFYSTTSFEIDPVTTLKIPNRNILPSDIFTASPSVKIYGEKRKQEIRHTIVSLDRSNRYTNDPQYISFHFSQPYMIGSLKLEISQESSYDVFISTNKNEWTRVFTEDDVDGWRTVTFEKQPVSMVKIVGTKALWPWFRIYGIKCPAFETQ